MIMQLGRMGAKARQAVPVLVKSLTDPEERVRSDAARALGDIGPEAGEAVPNLIQALGDKDNSLRSCAIYSLGKIGAAAKPAIPYLIEVLKDRSIRTEAIIALGQMGGPAKTAVPRLIDLLKPTGDNICGRTAFSSSHDYHRCDLYAAEALGNMGPAASEAVPALTHFLNTRPDPSSGQYDIETFHKIPAAALDKIATAEAVKASQEYSRKIKKVNEEINPQTPLPKLIEFLKNQDPLRRYYAAHYIERLVSRNAALNLQMAVNNKNEQTRAAAIHARGGIDPDFKEVVPALIQALQEQQLKIYAVVALANIGTPESLAAIRTMTNTVPALINRVTSSGEDYPTTFTLTRFSKNAVPELIKVLNDTNPATYSRAVSILMAMGTDAQDAIPVLIHALRDKDKYVCITSARALVRIGDRSVPALVRELENEDSAVRGMAMYTLGLFKIYREIPPVLKEALPTIKKALQDKNDTVRLYAAVITVWLSPGTKEVVPIFVMALKNDPKIRDLAMEALGELGAGAKDAVPEIMRTLDEYSIPARVHAADALSKIGADPEIIVPRLIEMLRDNDTWIRSTSIRALSRIGKPAIPELIQAFITGNRMTILATAYTFARMGSEATDAMPVLATALNNPDHKIRLRAAYALAQIKPEINEAVPILLKALNGRNYTDQCLAAHGLVAYNYYVPGDVPQIINALCSTNQGLGPRALDWGVIQNLQPNEKNIAAYLAKAAKDKDAEILKAANEALKGAWGSSRNN